MFDGSFYEQLRSGDDVPEKEKGGHRKPTKIVFFVFGFLLAVILAATIFLAGLREGEKGTAMVSLNGPDLMALDRDPPPILNKSCGSTPDEARARGCVFDMLTTAWTPAECADLELTEEWLKVVLQFETWPYYFDKHKKHPQNNMAQLRSGEWHGDLWSTMRLHKYHCLFIWRRLHMAYLGGKPADVVMRGLRHSLHCEEMMMSNDSLDAVAGVQSVYYREC